jgi:hypothetical protein
LENELGGMGLTNISPIVADDAPDIDRSAREQGLSGTVLSFSSLFTRLVELDISAARKEFDTWPTNDDTILPTADLGNRKAQVDFCQSCGLTHCAFERQRLLGFLSPKRLASRSVLINCRYRLSIHHTNTAALNE